MVPIIINAFGDKKNFKLNCFRRQTAEEREQERQAATKYFLSMQMGSMNSPPRDSNSHPSASDGGGAKANSEVINSIVRQSPIF